MKTPYFARLNESVWVLEGAVCAVVVVRAAVSNKRHPNAAPCLMGPSGELVPRFTQRETSVRAFQPPSALSISAK
jgi:hypothetical protein